MRVVGRLPLALLLGLFSSFGYLSAQALPNEYRLKAAFVFQFPQFVDWPPNADTRATIDLCVVRPNLFGSDLQDLVDGESLDNRPLRVREIVAVGGLPGCHLLFVSAHSNAGEILRAAASRPILTIGETEDFLEDGGIIALRVVDRRVRFEVDAANARRTGIRLSSQLMQLAWRVRGGPS